MTMAAAIKGKKLLHHIMKQTGAVGISGGIVDFLSIPAADNKACTFKLLQMVRNSGAAHFYHGRNVDNTFFAMAKQPEYAKTASISQLFEAICQCLKLGKARGMTGNTLPVVAVIMRKLDV